MASACAQPPRAMNSRNGSTTASRSVLGGAPYDARLVDQQGADDAGQHEERR